MTEGIEGHDIHKIYKEMRANCVNNVEKDTDLWIEWKPYGDAIHVDDSHCLCGVRICWEHYMINKINRVVIGPIGCVCILHCAGKMYKCVDCDKGFVEEIKRSNIVRRLRDSDYVCRKCTKSRDSDINMQLISLRRLENKFANSTIAGCPFMYKKKSDFEWACTVTNPKGKLKDFIYYYEQKDTINKNIKRLENKTVGRKTLKLGI